MTNNEEGRRVFLREFNEAIGKSYNGWRRVVGFHGHPFWLDQLIASAYLGLGGEAHTLITLGGEHEVGRAVDLHGVVVGESLLVTFTARGPAVKDVEWETTVRGLSSLSRLQVRASAVLNEPEDSLEVWPGSPNATLIFEDGAIVVLPADGAYVEQEAQRDALARAVMRLPSFLR